MKHSMKRRKFLQDAMSCSEERKKKKVNRKDEGR